MFSSSKGIAFALALAISTLTLMFFSLLIETTSEKLFLVGGLCFIFTFILVSVVLDYLIFNEINNIYHVLEKIQKKNISKIPKKSSKISLFPLRKINNSINAYAQAKNTEIETLQKNDTFRRDFIADISHELKTPLFAAQGFVHTLLDGAVEDKAVRYKFLKRAAKSLNTLEKLVLDLLTLNQMESGVVKFNLEDLDLKDIISDLIDQFEHKAEKREMVIRFFYDKSKSYRTLADKEKISQAIQNLIANAIKYNHQGGEVIINLKTSKNNLKLEVKDNGKGIPPEDLNRIFERFYRVEKSRSREKGGTGLGLAIVKHILEGHKSKILVSSELGKGSTFSFFLPLSKKKENEKGPLAKTE
jgi:two-component system phosphate regulon sensor histidine kinase PhoR